MARVFFRNAATLNVNIVNHMSQPSTAKKETSMYYQQTQSVPQSVSFLLPDVDPSSTPRLTVVLDLDETLVCNRKLHLTQALLRPYAKEFLKALNRSLMEVVVWTASTDDTALPVLRQLDPEGTLIEHVIFRNAHWYTEPQHTKDLRLLGRPLSRVVLVDNAPNCCKLQAHNAVLVEDFTGVDDARDTTLIGIFRVLDTLAQGVMHRDNVPAMLQRIADSDKILQHATVMLPQSYTPKEVITGAGHYTHTSMPSNPPQGAFFRVKRVPIPVSSHFMF